MQIIIHDTNELSELDLTVLKALVGVESSTPAAANKASSTAAPAAEKAAPAAKKAAAAAPAKKAAAKPEPDPEPEAEEEEPEAEDEDLVGGPTMADAVALATKLVSEGRAVEVKSTLAECGAAKRVSELEGDNIAKFVNAFA